MLETFVREDRASSPALCPDRQRSTAPAPMTIKIPTLFLHALFSAVCVASDALEEPVLFGDAFSSDDAVSCGMPDLLFSE